jgi:hypothetical protein
MNNFHNCDIKINVLSLQTYRSHESVVLKVKLTGCNIMGKTFSVKDTVQIFMKTAKNIQIPKKKKRTIH